MTVKDYDAKIVLCVRKMSKCLKDYKRFKSEADTLYRERAKLLDDMELIPRLFYTSEKSRELVKEYFK